MISRMAENGRKNRPDGDTRGTVLECELCSTEQVCHEHSGMVVCRSCRHDLLPDGGLF